MSEAEPTGKGEIKIAGHSFKSTTLLIAGAVAIVAVLVIRSGSQGTTGTAVAVGAQGEPGVAGPQGPAGSTADVSAELAALTAQLNAATQWEKQFTAAIYTIKAGDTWASLAAQFKTSVATLKQLNPHVAIPRVGQGIVIPLQPVPA